MSRPNGPVRHPGMPAQSEFPSENHGAQGAGLEPDPYAGQQPQQGAAPAGHAPQQPAYPTPDQAQYAQGARNQGYAPAQYQDPNQHAAPQQPIDPQTNAGYDPALGAGGGGPSWADMNQPVAQPNAPAPGYADHASYAAQPAQHQQQTPSFQDQSFQDPAYQRQAYVDPNGAVAPHAQAGHAHYQQPAPPLQPTTPTAAPSGYDFAGYEAPQPTPQHDAGFQVQPDPNVDWGQAGFAPVGGAVAPAGGLDVGQQQPLHAEDSYAGEDEFEYEDEDEPGRGRGMLVAAALAGAIVIGGGVAYGYQTIFGTPSSGKPPVVRGATGPAKVKPADPGGRKFAHTDSKIMGRLGSASGRTNDPSGNARRVSTLRIGRDGSVMAPSNPAAGSTGNRMVTGLTLGGTPVAATAANAVTAKPAAAQKPLVVKPPVVKAPVKVVTAKPVAPTVKAVAPVVTTKKVTPAVKQVALAKPAPVAVGPKPTGVGYVAVLASVPVSKTSRMDSLKQFANMQQKYGAALANKTPDVQQANLGAKGTYHRLIVGPPGSAQSAREVCTSLKTAGYNSCWVLAY